MGSRERQLARNGKAIKRKLGGVWGFGAGAGAGDWGTGDGDGDSATTQAVLIAFES